MKFKDYLIKACENIGISEDQINQGIDYEFKVIFSKKDYGYAFYDLSVVAKNREFSTEEEE